LGLKETHADVTPFLLTQPYIADVRLHDGTNCDVNLSKWRDQFFFHTDSWHTVFKRHYGITWSKSPWFTIEGNSAYANTVFISTSPNRWWSQPFDHKKLVSRLGPDVRFLAFEKSNYDHFVSKTGITLPLVIAKSFTEIVSIIQGCKMFVSTLSSPLSVADALHKKRIALQLEDDLDAMMASKTNPSFVTYRSNLDSIQ